VDDVTAETAALTEFAKLRETYRTGAQAISSN
jgi:hypothetical protein